MPTLSPDALDTLPAAIRRPAYDRRRLSIGLAHIGVGAFHRCHQAEYTDDMIEAGFGPFGVLGINLRPPRLSESLGRQGGVYSRTLRKGDAAETRVIGCILATIDAESAEGAETAISALADPSISTVTLTLTEKGYCHVPATGRLDLDNADLQADLAGGGVPRTALGLLAAALSRRRALGHGGPTLISCDNIPANGTILKRGLLDFAAHRSDGLAGWIESEVAFPSTMVDRIVPATAAADLAFAEAALGIGDLGAVVGEPFRQWVIEDEFATGRPPWDRAGASFVADVTPYELIKMRVLNAAQSTLSHLGALLGHEYSFEAAADPLLAGLVRAMLEAETATTLPAIAAMPVPPYVDTTFERIRNPAIRHRCHQIGTDGSQKIVQRILNPLRERLADGRPAERLTLSAAAWIAYVAAGSTAFAARWAPIDPFAAPVIAIAERCGGDMLALARGVLAIDAIFGALATDAMARAVAEHLQGLLSAEPRAYLASRRH